MMSEVGGKSLTQCRKGIEETGRFTQGSHKETIAKMASEQGMTQTLVQAVIEAAIAAIMAVEEAATWSMMQDQYMQCPDQLAQH